MRISNSGRIYLLISFSLALVSTGFSQAPPVPRDTSVSGPQTFAMIMGISSYKYVRPLSYADKDAELFRDYLKSPAGGAVKEDNIFMMLNEQAVSAVFWGKGFQWLKAKKLQQGDRLFIYLAGHGDAIDEDQFFYLTYDCNPAGDKNNYLVGGTIQLFNLKKKIAAETAKGVEVFFIMDACRSNELPGGSEGQNFLNAAISEKRAGEIIMLATGAGQESLEDESIGSGHGLFTYYLVDGLSGLADTEGSGDNKVTLDEIQKYVDRNVPSIAQQRFRRKQDPFFCCVENNSKVIGNVDMGYLKRWMELRKKGGGNSFAGKRINSQKRKPVDTLLLETYQQFYAAIRDNRLTGNNSAEYFSGILDKQFPGNRYTQDARTMLAVSFINVAQAKINLYLDCRDAVSIQRLRAQQEESGIRDENGAGIDRMEKLAMQEDATIGKMLEKAIAIVREDDPDFAEALTGQLYFFKSRGYFGRTKKDTDIRQAFGWAHAAYARDKKAAYILNTLSALHLDNYRYDSAIYYAKKAIAEAPSWRYPYVTLAFSYRTLNKPDSAIRYYRRSIDTDPHNADAWVDLGHYFFSLGKNDSAQVCYARALSIEPGNVYALNNTGWIYYHDNYYSEAIRYFKQAVALDPGLINAYSGIGKAYFAREQYDSAKLWYEKAFVHYRDPSFVNVYIGNFFRELNAWDSAKVYYRRAVETDPTYEEGWNYLGLSCTGLRQYDSARYYYRKTLEVNPSSAFAWLNTGLVYRELKQADSAGYYFNRAVFLDPRNPSLLNNIGVIMAEDKQYDSARYYFRRALDVRPDYSPALNNLLKVFRDKGQQDSVTRIIRELSGFEKDSPAFFHDMARLFTEQRRYDSARWYMQQAISMDPQNARLFTSMSLAMQGLKLVDSARWYQRQAIRLGPEDAALWLRMAELYKQQKKTDSAVYYFRNYLQVRGDKADAQAMLQTGNFFAELKRADSAIYYYRLAISMDPGYGQPWLQAGTWLMKMEEYDSSLIYLKEAVKLLPRNFTATYNLGLNYHVLAQYEQAIQYLVKAVQLDPGRGDVYYQLACTYALNKKPEQSILYLRQAFERGYKGFDNLQTDPDLEILKPYKEFQALIEQYKPGKKD